jgi:hypothetical protein
MLKVVLRLIRRRCAHTQKTTLKAQDLEQNKARPYEISWNFSIMQRVVL